MKTKPLKNNKAQAVFLVLVLIASVMSIGLIFGVITARKLHTMVEVGESVKAYYAAESGIECDLYKNFVDPNTVCDGEGAGNMMSNETEFKLEETQNGSTFIITSVGTSKKTKRSIQVQY